MKEQRRRTSFPLAERQHSATAAAVCAPSHARTRLGNLLEQIPALVAEVASEQAALSAIQGVLAARLLVTPAVHDSAADVTDY